MIVLIADNLTACSVEVVGKKFCPAINDGQETYYFTAFQYGGEANAVDHARKTILGLQTTLDTQMSNWSMEKKDGSARKN